MVVVRALWESDPVEYLVHWKFPEIVAFGPLEAHKRSSFTPAQWQELQNKAQAYREELWGKSDDQIQPLIAEARRDETRRYNEYREAEERKRIFNQPAAGADFAHWASASYWTLDEMVALSFGKDPRVVTWKTVSPYVNISPFAKAFESRRDLIYRAGVMGQLAKQTAPSIVLAWAERMNIPMPAELVDAVKALGTQIADWKTLHDGLAVVVEQMQGQLDEKHSALMGAMADHSQTISKMAADYTALLAQKDELIEAKDEALNCLMAKLAEIKKDLSQRAARPVGPRERDSLLKLIIGMAMDGYGYDPKAARSPIAKELAGHLALRGLSLDEDTVRKYLAEARQLLPGDETEQNR